MNQHRSDALFAVFGSDSDSSDHDDSPVDVSDDNDTANWGRHNPRGGVLTFHPGTEQALLCYVLQKLQRNDEDEESSPPPPQQHQQRCRRILDAVDEFCWQRHWMMHVGPSKGKILQDFLRQQLQQQQRLDVGQRDDDNECVIVVELGTYCGYSLITMAETLLREVF